MTRKFGFEPFERAAKTNVLKKALLKTISDANFRAGEVLRRKIILGIRKQRPEWPALSPFTVKKKKELGQSSLTLIADAEMFKAITTLKIGKLAAFVGVPAGIPKKKGESAGIPIATYAALHEFGGIVKRGNTVVRIPKRSWAAPSIPEAAPGMQRVYAEGLRETINKVLGGV